MRVLREEYRMIKNEYNRDFMRRKKDGSWTRKIAPKGEKEEKTAVSTHLTDKELRDLMKLSNELELSRSKIIKNCYKLVIEQLAPKQPEILETLKNIL